MKTKQAAVALLALSAAVLATSCKPKGIIQKVESGTAEKVFVPPGKKDEMYNFVSGGFSGQVAVYGLPSGRLFRERTLGRPASPGPLTNQGRARRPLGLRQCQQHASRGSHQHGNFPY